MKWNTHCEPELITHSIRVRLMICWLYIEEENPCSSFPIWRSWGCYSSRFFFFTNPPIPPPAHTSKQLCSNMTHQHERRRWLGERSKPTRDVTDCSAVCVWRHHLVNVRTAETWCVLMISWCELRIKSRHPLYTCCWDIVQTINLSTSHQTRSSLVSFTYTHAFTLTFELWTAEKYRNV